MLVLKLSSVDISAFNQEHVKSSDSTVYETNVLCAKYLFYIMSSMLYISSFNCEKSIKIQANKQNLDIFTFNRYF